MGMAKPWGWAVRRAGDWPCSNGDGTVRSGDARDSPPRPRSELRSVAGSPTPTRQITAVRPCASICCPESSKKKNQINH